jgi:putative transcription antitermination factor YqgF
MICSPLKTIPFVSESSLARSLAALCRQMHVSLVVIGLPLSADGSEGEGCARARRLRDRLLADGIACELWDESWSSRDAGEALSAAGGSRRAAKSRLDSVAASLFLRDYIDSASRGARPPSRHPEGAQGAEG